jgi:protoheme IX farnesyltransferase
MSNESSARPATWQCYLGLCKSNVVIEMVFTAIVGMLLAVPALPPLGTAMYAIVGIALAASSAAAINHFVDQHIDMHLNPHRPIPMQYLTPNEVLIFALLTGVPAIVLLALTVNVLTAGLTLFAALGYAVIYSKYLKYWTPQNIVIGGAFGAMPPLLGWAAITNTIHPYALLLVLIIFVWTPPHFWPLAIAREKKYQGIYSEFGIPMLPVTHGAAYTRLHILFYSMLLLVVTLLPYLVGMSGLLYLLTIVPLDLVFIAFTVMMMGQRETLLYRLCHALTVPFAHIMDAVSKFISEKPSDRAKNPDPLFKMTNHEKRTALQTFWYSLIYITALFAILLIDHYFKITL